MGFYPNIIFNGLPVDMMLTIYEGLHKAGILDKFNFVPSDVLLGLGSWTGTLALKIKKQTRLEHPVICVEPCEEMVNIAKKIEGITVIQATAVEFASQAISSYHFNNCLLYTSPSPRDATLSRMPSSA